VRNKSQKIWKRRWRKFGMLIIKKYIKLPQNSLKLFTLPYRLDKYITSCFKVCALYFVYYIDYWLYIKLNNQMEHTMPIA
jgi:hypothetical protein